MCIIVTVILNLTEWSVEGLISNYVITFGRTLIHEDFCLPQYFSIGLS